MAALKAANAIAAPWACVVFLLLLGELFAQLGGDFDAASEKTAAAAGSGKSSGGGGGAKGSKGVKGARKAPAEAVADPDFVPNPDD